MTPHVFSAYVEAVAKAFDVQPRALLGQVRTPQVADARKALYWLLRHNLSVSYPRLGQVLKRHHTTVLYGVESVNARIKARDEAFLDRLFEAGRAARRRVGVVPRGI